MRLILTLSLTLALSNATAAEYAVLNTGFRLFAESHELRGDKVRLYTPSGGVMELPAAAIVSFEPSHEFRPPQPPPEPEPPQSLEDLIDQAAAALDVHPDLVRSVIAAESANDPSAVSPKGALGLMQLMPATARDLGVDPLQPSENVAGGARYLRQMLDRYRGRPDGLVQALAAYNAGPGAVDRHAGLPPYSETRQYVRRVLKRFLELTDRP